MGKPIAAGKEQTVAAPARGDVGAAPEIAAADRHADAFLPFGLTIVAFVLTYWAVDVVSPALPDARRALALSATEAGLVFSAFFVGRLVGNLPAALLVERAGPRWTTVAGGALLFAGSFLAAIAHGETVLLAGRAVQGGGIALLVTAELLSVLRARPGSGAAMTTFNLAADVGSGLALIVGGIVAEMAGWRGVFVVCIALATAIVFGTAATWRRPAGVPSHAPGPGIPSPSGAASPPRASRGVLGRLVAANLLVYVNYSVFVVGLPLFAAARFNTSAGRIGTLLLAATVAHFLAAVPAGRAIRRWGAPRALGIGFALSAAGMGLVLAAPAESWLIIPMALYGAGQVAGTSAGGDLLLHLGGRGGRAVGLVRVCNDVGLVAGPVAFGVLADAAGIAAPFVALTALTVLAALAAVRGLRTEG